MFHFLKSLAYASGYDITGRLAPFRLVFLPDGLRRSAWLIQLGFFAGRRDHTSRAGDEDLIERGRASSDTMDTRSRFEHLLGRAIEAANDPSTLPTFRLLAQYLGRAFETGQGC